jgi:glycerol-3-phosphate O-acyltransferase / dihydroxyacetone phosphate acyltransferase
VVELNRRLIKGYERFKDDPRIIELTKNVMAYNRTLLQLNIRDHQVENASLPRIKVLSLIIYRLGKLALLKVAVLPGLILFSPVFVAGKLISIQKSKEALAASSVKIRAHDVLATWKLLVSLVLAPVLYVFYDIILGIITYQNRLYGLIPEWVPLWFVLIAGFVLFGSITYAALRFGEIGMDIVKSLRPLFIALSPHHGNTVQKLRKRREELSIEVTEVINELGPEIFADFEKKRIVPDIFHEQLPPDSSNTEEEEASRPQTPSSPGIGFSQLHLPRNESLHDLSNIGVFASRPTTPYHPRSRSRTNSVGVGLSFHGFSPLESKESVDELSQKVRAEMKQRTRRRKSEGGGWESDSSSTGSHLDGLTMTKKND